MAELTRGNSVIKKNRQGYGYQYTDLATTYNYINNELKMESHPVLDMWPEPKETKLGLMFGFVKTKYRKIGEKEWSEPEAPFPIIVGVATERIGKDGKLKQPEEIMQRLGKATTYAIKYSVRAAFGLADTDDDGQTSGIGLDVPMMSDATKKRVDEILDISGISDKDSADELIRNALGNRRMSLDRLTETQAKRFINVYEMHQKQTAQANAQARNMANRGDAK